MAPRRRKAVTKAKPATAADLTRLPESLLIDCVLPFAGYRASFRLDTVLKGRLSAQENAWERALEVGRRGAFGITRAEAMAEPTTFTLVADDGEESEVDAVPGTANLPLLNSVLHVAVSEDEPGDDALFALQTFSQLLALGIRGTAETLMATAMRYNPRDEQCVSIADRSGVYTRYHFDLYGRDDVCTDALQMLLDAGLDPDVRFIYAAKTELEIEATALHTALTNPYWSVEQRRVLVRILLDAGAKPETVSIRRNGTVNALTAAIALQDVGLVKTILTASRDPKALVLQPYLNPKFTWSKDVVTPLTDAVARKSWPVVKLLLDTAPEAIREETLLHSCARRHGPALIAAGAVVTSKQECSGNTALHLALRPYHMHSRDGLGLHFRHSSTSEARAFIDDWRLNQRRFFDALLESGVDVASKNAMGQTALHVVCEYPPGEPFESETMNEVCDDHLTYVDKLVSGGCNINAKDNKNAHSYFCDNGGLTALLYAVPWMNEAGVEALIALGADVTAKDSKKWNALHHAMRAHGLPSYSPRFPKGRHDRERNLCRPLAEQIFERKTKVVAALIRAGVDANAKNSDGLTPLMFALQQKDTFGKTYGQFMFQDLPSLCPLFEVLIGASNLSARTRNRDSVLTLAAPWANAEIVRALLDAAGPSLNLNWRNHIGKTALILAVAARPPQIETCRLLLERGAKPNLRDMQGRTALAYAQVSYTPEAGNDDSFGELLRKHGGRT